MRASAPKASIGRCILSIEVRAASCDTGSSGKGNIMLNDIEQRGPDKSTHIDVFDGFELRYWAKSLNVSLEQVKSAVRKVGPDPVLVRGELKHQGFY
jgi:hypothetical protein